MNEPKKLLAVDGSNLLFQMFYGMPARITNSAGRPIHGTLGFIGALLRMIRSEHPTHVIVLFDGETENPRRELAPDYKANRPDFSDMPEDETPFSQLPDVYAALDAIGIKHAETRDLEADDILAAYAALGSSDLNVLISSFDSDLFQLIDDHTSILRYRGDASKVYTGATVFEKFGVSPSLYADYKALVGDRSDNIAGAPGIGPKTASALISEFGSLEKIIASADRIKKDRIRLSVCENKERLLRNLALIRLSSDHALPYTLGELSFGACSESSVSLLKRLGIY